MKKIVLLFFILSCQFSFGQGGTWTWIGGTDSANANGVYGTQGIPSVNNHPSGLYAMGSWQDRQGNFWIYGGEGPLDMSDLWKYNPVTYEWTWMKGNGKDLDHPVFGTKGVPNLANSPGYRESPVTWVDTSGALWLFSGYNWGNDLWKYDISTNEWTLTRGDTIPYTNGAYGTKGVPGALNSPGSREESSSWTDSLNNLWLFGGLGWDANGTYGPLNDLWKYNISSNKWTWIKGSNSANAPISYGSKGIPAASNDPGRRIGYTNCKDEKGNFWIMGSCPTDEYLNDVWKYDLKTNDWTWMSGTNVPDDPGNYISNCVFDTINLPEARVGQTSASDNCGRFWLFEGVYLHSYNPTLNDLWVFDPQQLKWNWISGTNVANQPNNYGTLGVSSPSNMPSSRADGAGWWGNDNKFYIFGGWQLSTGNLYGDVWVFNPDTNCVPVCGAVDGIVEVESSNTITLYPNPATNQLTIHTSLHNNEAITVSIMNVLGQDVSTPLNVRRPLSEVEVDVSKFAAGIYFVQVVGENKRWVGKFVKE